MVCFPPPTPSSFSSPSLSSLSLTLWCCLLYSFEYLSPCLSNTCFLLALYLQLDDEVDVSPAVVELGKLLLRVILAAHFCACVWMFVTVVNHLDKTLQDIQGTNWWLKDARSPDEPLSIYIASIYVGDGTPHHTTPHHATYHDGRSVLAGCLLPLVFFCPSRPRLTPLLVQPPFHPSLPPFHSPPLLRRSSP